MPLYDYECSDGHMFEAFRPYGEHTTTPDPRSEDGSTCRLVWRSSGNVWTDEWGERKKRRLMESKGYRVHEPGMDRDTDNKKKYIQDDRDKRRKDEIAKIVTETVQ